MSGQVDQADASRADSDNWEPRPRPWRVGVPEYNTKEWAILDANGYVVTSLRIDETKQGAARRIMEFFSKSEMELVVACVNALADVPYQMLSKGYLDVRIKAEGPALEPQVPEEEIPLCRSLLVGDDKVLIYGGEIGEHMVGVCSTNVRFARRIVACVNACAGTTTEALELGKKLLGPETEFE